MALAVNNLVNYGKAPSGDDMSNYSHVAGADNGLDDYTEYHCNGAVNSGHFGGGA